MSHNQPTSSVNPPKNKKLSIYNAVMAILLVPLMGATITLGVLSGVRLNQARDLTAQTKQIAAQTKATQTTNWCSSVRADNRADMGEIYNEYRTATDERRQAIDAECPNKVAIANLVSTYTAEDVFKFDQTCSLNDNKTAAHCTGSIEVLADKKPALSVYPSVSVTLVFTVTYDTVATQVGHTEPNAYTFTVPREGKADFEFDTAYDEKWGSYYKLYPNAFYPDE